MPILAMPPQPWADLLRPFLAHVDPQARYIACCQSGVVMQFAARPSYAHGYWSAGSAQRLASDWGPVGNLPPHEWLCVHSLCYLTRNAHGVATVAITEVPPKEIA